MNTNETNTLNEARQSILNELTTAKAKHESAAATPEAQELDEQVSRKPSMRSGIMLVIF